jgi:hypothetical protein
VRHEIRFIHSTDKDAKVSSIRILFEVHGKRGMVFLEVFTGWGANENEAFAAGIGIHSPRPLWDGHRLSVEPCDHTPGGQCYFSLSTSIDAGPVWDVFLHDGEAALWALLDARYLKCIEGAEGG